MATVITNLLSAIPVFGKDLVELIWIKDKLIINVQYLIKLSIINLNSMFNNLFKFMATKNNASNNLPTPQSGEVILIGVKYVE